MSLGFSVGDFLAVIKLASKIRKDFVGAPSQFKDASGVVRSLLIVIQDAEVAADERDLSDKDRVSLKAILEGCHNTLSKLESALAQYTELDAQPKGLGGKAKRVWKRLSFEPEDIRNLRTSVNEHIDLLNAFAISQVREDTTILVKGQKEQQQRTMDQDQKAILDWITPIDYFPQQNDFINARQAGTGQWLLDSDKYQEWIKTKNQTLFCPGIPGAGKTILTSIVINNLQDQFRGDSNVAIVYIYCNFRRHMEQTLEHLLAALLKQLAGNTPTLPSSVKSLHDHCKSNKSRPTADELSTTLKSVASEYSQVFIIVDALDECSETNSCRAKLLSSIFALQNQCEINIFATSRHIPDIEDSFIKSSKLEIRASKQDVQRYLAEHISDLPNCVKRNPDLQDEIVSEIVEAVDGMFLLAKLHLNSLEDKRSPTAIRTVLQTLPTGSGSIATKMAYSTTMERIESKNKNDVTLAKRTIAWIGCAKRPLTTIELQHALAVIVDQDEFEAELDKENISDIEDIISVCSGLVTFDEESNIVRLIHYTAQEYFDNLEAKWFLDSHLNITATLSTYLSYDAFASGFCDTGKGFKERATLNPLYEYAVDHWGYHTSRVSSLPPIVLDFIDRKGNVEAAAQAKLTVLVYGNLNEKLWIPRKLTGLHLAVFHNAINVVQIIIQHDHGDLERKDSDGRTPLSHAAEWGHEEILKLLLDMDNITSDSRDINGRTPLSYAAECGHEEILKLLLDMDNVNPDSRDEKGRSPLSWAAKCGHEEILKLLLDMDNVNPDSRDEEGRSPLSWAAESGNAETFRLLLNSGQVDISSMDHSDRTPLFWAGTKGAGTVVDLLLNTGKVDSDINLQDKNGNTPFFVACELGNEETVKILVDTGKVDYANSKNHRGRTPLSKAVRNGKEVIVKLLLDTGKFDDMINLKDTEGRTLLLLACERGHMTVVKMLMDTGKIDYSNSKDHNGDTPLSMAASRGQESVVELLLHTGKFDDHINSKDNNGRTLLFKACWSGNEGVVKLLLDTGDNSINVRDTEGHTPLSMLCSRAWPEGYDVEVVKLLLKTGKISAKLEDSYFLVPALWAAKRGKHELLKLLLGHAQVQYLSEVMEALVSVFKGSYPLTNEESILNE